MRPRSLSSGELLHGGRKWMRRGVLQRAADREVRDGSWLRLGANCTKTVSTWMNRMQLRTNQWVYLPKSAAGVNESTEHWIDTVSALTDLAGRTVVFVGDSYLRELYESSIELLSGAHAARHKLQYSRAGSVPPQYVLDNSTLRRAAGCSRTRRTIDGAEKGFDLACDGWNDLRVWQGGNNTTLIFSFHAYYTASAEFEQLTFDRLNDGTLQPRRLLANASLPLLPPANALVISEGVWGAAPSKYLGRSESSMQQLKALYRRTTSSFAGPILWIAGSSAETFQRGHHAPPAEWLRWLRNASAVEGSNTLVFERGPIAKRARAARIPAEHGYRGDVAYTMSRMLIELLTGRLNIDR